MKKDPAKKKKKKDQSFKPVLLPDAREWGKHAICCSFSRHALNTGTSIHSPRCIMDLEYVESLYCRYTCIKFSFILPFASQFVFPAMSQFAARACTYRGDVTISA